MSSDEGNKMKSRCILWIIAAPWELPGDAGRLWSIERQAPILLQGSRASWDGRTSSPFTIHWLTPSPRESLLTIYRWPSADPHHPVETKRVLASPRASRRQRHAELRRTVSDYRDDEIFIGPIDDLRTRNYCHTYTSRNCRFATGHDYNLPCKYRLWLIPSRGVVSRRPKCRST